MLCRIDLASPDAIVGVFPFELDSSFSPSIDQWTPSGWVIDDATNLVLWERPEVSDTDITISGWSGSATVDPTTLELLAVEESGS